MNWFPLHIGDFTIATTDLTPSEVGFYMRLLCRYYADEYPLQREGWTSISTPPCIFLLCGAHTKEEKDGVDRVLSRFFVLEGNLYHNKRADIEIKKASEIREKKSTGALNRWKETREKAPTTRSGVHKESSIDSILQPTTYSLQPSLKGSSPPLDPPSYKGNGKKPPVDKSVPAPEKKKKAALRDVPASFKISDRVKAWAKEKNYGRLNQHLEHFISTCHAKGYQYADHDAAFMNAIRKDWAGIAKDEKVRVEQSADWWETSQGIITKGKEYDIAQNSGEPFPYFKARVFAEAGDGPWLRNAK